MRKIEKMALLKLLGCVIIKNVCKKGVFILKVIEQICVVFAICLIAEGISAILPFPFPASVLSMVLLFLLLATRILHPHHLKEKTEFLLGNMALFFVPACVSLLKYKDALFENLIPILLICILTTPVVFFVTGHVVQLTMRFLQKRGGIRK